MTQPDTDAERDDPFAPPPGTELLRTRSATFWIGAENITRMICHEGHVHSAADARENIDLFVGALRQPRPVLVDVRKLGGVNREAREIYRDRDQNPDLVAVAMVVESPLSRVIGNFFLGLNKVYVPTRLFTSAVEALEWLRKHGR